MTSYVVAEADDRYRVVFALAVRTGPPISPKLGPLRLVAPHEKRPARWVRMLKSITIFTNRLAGQSLGLPQHRLAYG